MISDDLRDEELLKAKEAAKLLNVHPTTITRWAKSGKLPYALTPGGRKLYRKSVILEIVDRK